MGQVSDGVIAGLAGLAVEVRGDMAGLAGLVDVRWSGCMGQVVWPHRLGRCQRWRQVVTWLALLAG